LGGCNLFALCWNGTGVGAGKKCSRRMYAFSDDRNVKMNYLFYFDVAKENWESIRHVWVAVDLELLQIHYW